MKLTSKLITFSFALIMSGYSYASADSAIASAEKAQQAAAEVGYEWRDTGLMIKEAKKLAASGKNEEAIKLAKRAEEEGLDALNQYRTEMSRYSKSH
ncbi:MAG: hypothetical protein GY744_00070 [Gammaproteobacteria bacterium]|nr:hypothetical protein [Gammaproteobacteria bacterium]